jgi:hypothetical protein
MWWLAAKVEGAPAAEDEEVAHDMKSQCRRKLSAAAESVDVSRSPPSRYAWYFSDIFKSVRSAE